MKKSSARTDSVNPEKLFATIIDSISKRSKPAKSASQATHKDLADLRKLRVFDSKEITPPLDLLGDEPNDWSDSGRRLIDFSSLTEPTQNQLLSACLSKISDTSPYVDPNIRLKNESEKRIFTKPQYDDILSEIKRLGCLEIRKDDFLTIVDASKRQMGVFINPDFLSYLCRHVAPSVWLCVYMHYSGIAWAKFQANQAPLSVGVRLVKKAESRFIPKEPEFFRELVSKRCFPNTPNDEQCREMDVAREDCALVFNRLWLLPRFSKLVEGIAVERVKHAERYRINRENLPVNDPLYSGFPSIAEGVEFYFGSVNEYRSILEKLGISYDGLFMVDENNPVAACVATSKKEIETCPIGNKKTKLKPGRKRSELWAWIKEQWTACPSITATVLFDKLRGLPRREQRPLVKGNLAEHLKANRKKGVKCIESCLRRVKQEKRENGVT